MIQITTQELAICIVLLVGLSAWIAFMVGYFMGKRSESDSVMEYYTRNQMSLTGELVRDRYTFSSTSDYQKPAKK